MKALRKFTRDKLRKRVGNRNLKDVWQKFQMRKYGEDYRETCFQGGRKRKGVSIHV